MEETKNEALFKILEIHHYIEKQFPQKIYLDVPLSDFAKARNLGCHFDCHCAKFYIYNNTQNQASILQLWNPIVSYA